MKTQQGTIDKKQQRDLFQFNRPESTLDGVIETALRACSGSCLDVEAELLEVKTLVSVCIKAHFKLTSK